VHLSVVDFRGERAVSSPQGPPRRPAGAKAPNNLLQGKGCRRLQTSKCAQICISGVCRQFFIAVAKVVGYSGKGRSLKLVIEDRRPAAHTG
jgi:hypothetical protein